MTDGTADAKRVYVAGISNGGAMAMTLVCARADLFAAGASVIMNLTDEAAVTCHPSRPLPMLLINGTADPLVPYEGGRGSSYYAADGFWSTEETLAFWRKLNGCEHRRRRRDRLAREGARGSVHGDTDLLALSQQGTTSCSIASTMAATACPDSLRMPASRRLRRSLLGPQNRDIDGAETIWSFFSRFP